MRHSEHCYISNNTLSNQSESIFLQQNAYANVITDNTITNAGFGIVLRHGVGYNSVMNNKVSDCLRGIWLQQAPFPNLLQGNKISKVTHEGIYVEYATGSIIADNTIFDFQDSWSKMGGIYIYRSNKSHILNNIVERSPAGGISLFSSSISEIRGNHISDSKYGIGLWYDSHENSVSNNQLTDNARNIIVDLSKDNIMSKNHFEGGDPNGYDNSGSYWCNNFWSDYPGWDGGSGVGVAPYFICPNGIDPSPLIAPPSIKHATVPLINTPSEFPFLDGRADMPPITTSTVWENKEVDFLWGWQLIIASGGSLTLDNITLRGASAWTSEPQILVRSGAGLYIYNSRIIGGELDCPLAISIEPGGVCVIKSTLLKNLGGEGGVNISGNGSIIENNRFEKCWRTINIWEGTGNRIVNNVLDRCHDYIRGDHEQNTILDNDETETISNFDKNEPCVYPNVFTTLKNDTATISIGLADETSLDIKFRTGNVSGKQVSLTYFGKSISTCYEDLLMPSLSLCFYYLVSNIQSEFSAEMSFSYSDSALIRNGIHERDLSIAYYDTLQSLWITVPTNIDSARNILKADINHFSLWGIVVPDDYEKEEHPWDANSDGVVDILDLILVGKHFGESGDNIVGDTNNDGQVNIFDLALVGSHFGEKAAPSIHDISLLQRIYDLLKAEPDPNPNLKLALRELEKSLVPSEAKLLQSYPNPSNPDMWIPYQLKEDARVVIRIHTATGQLVRTLNLGRKQAGFYIDKERAAYWDGKNEVGESVASGVYFYSIKTGDFSATRKMVVRK